MCDVKLVLKLVLIIQLKKHRFKRVNAIKLSYRISVAKKVMMTLMFPRKWEHVYRMDGSNI